MSEVSNEENIIVAGIAGRKLEVDVFRPTNVSILAVSRGVAGGGRIR